MQPTNNLKILRTKHGFTLRELGNMTGISNSYLSQLENGIAQNPTIYKARQLASILKTTAEELFFERVDNKVALHFTVKEIENGYILEQKDPLLRIWGFRNDEELICFIGAYLLELPH
jgi:transcriptional regulator with XRE-family HTH domain